MLDLGAGRRPGRGRPQRHPPDPSGDARHRRGAARGRTAASPRACSPTQGVDLVAALRRLRGHRPRVQPLDRRPARAPGRRSSIGKLEAALAAARTEAETARARRGAGPGRPDPRGRLPRGDAGAPGARRHRRRRCAATSGSGRCSTRSSTSSLRRRPRRSTSRSSRASSQPAAAAAPPGRRTCSRRSPSSSSRPRRSSCPAPSRYFGAIFRDEMIGALSRFRDWLVIDGEQGGPTPPTYRAYYLRISLHGRDDSILVGDAARRPGRRPLHLVRAADGDARRHGGAAPDRAAPPRGRAQRAPLGAAAAVGARDRQPDGPQVRALDAGAGADGRVAGRERGPRRGDPARPDRHHARTSPRRWWRWRRSCNARPDRLSPASGAGPSSSRNRWR